MMPIFLQRSNGTVLGTTLTLSGLQNQLSAFSRQLSAKPNSCHPERRALPRRTYATFLPPVMRERLVRFRHPVHIFFLLDRGAFSTGRVQQFVGPLVAHSLF